MYRIEENDDGTATVRRAFNRSVVGTHADMAAAQAWIDAKDLTDQTAQQARDQGLNARCHYCGLPTVRGVCRECGTEI